VSILGHTWAGVHSGLGQASTRLRSPLEQRPDMTLAELQARLSEKGIAFGICTLWRCLTRQA
jgi:hypothetical protein